jgi:hypothetical protein
MMTLCTASWYWVLMTPQTCLLHSNVLNSELKSSNRYWQAALYPVTKRIQHFLLSGAVEIQLSSLASAMLQQHLNADGACLTGPTYKACLEEADDVFPFGQMFHEQLQSLWGCTRKFQEAYIKLMLEKWQVFREKVQDLRHGVSQEVINDPEMLEVYNAGHCQGTNKSLWDQ